MWTHSSKYNSFARETITLSDSEILSKYIFINAGGTVSVFGARHALGKKNNDIPCHVPEFQRILGREFAYISAKLANYQVITAYSLNT
jgi:hypothetical protein